MTLRRYAPLALAVLAAACKPDIEQRTNTRTADYAVFDPSNSEIPMPNTIALSQFEASDPGPAALPCSYFLPDTTRAGLCAFARAGAFPDFLPITIGFQTGTLPSEGPVQYEPATLDTATLHFAAAAATPSIGLFDITNPTVPVPITDATPTFAAGTLTITPSGGTWTAGHSYLALVRGGANGVKNGAGDEILAMPIHFILREAVLHDLDLQLPDNQGLFPGTPEEKAATGALLEPIRAAYKLGIYPLTLGLQGAGIDLPFSELIALQSFSIIGTGRTITIGEAAASDPAAGTIAAGATKAIDAFTVQANVGTATIVAVTVALSDPSAAVAALSVNAAPDCGVATSLGTLSTVASGANTVVLSTFPSAPFSPATSTLYVCATASAATGTVSGNVAVVTAFTGTGYVSTDGDASAVSFAVN